MPNKLTKEEFIARAREVHGDKYDYSLVEYINSYTKVTIICKIHGKFEQRPAIHIYRKSGCQKCYIATQTLTKEEFIARAREVHRDKYDYSSVKYVNNRKKVTIICKNHGKFEQTPTSHVDGKRGCKKCASETMALTTEEFIAKAKEVHGDKYDYSLVKYVNYCIKLPIICKIHGKFEQTPMNHIASKCGCPECGVAQTLTREEFISKAKEVHGDKYDYSSVKYVGSHKKVPIICKIHGKFEQTPTSHIDSKSGCKKCATETLILTTEEFISKAEEVHGDKYDYSSVKYVGSHKKVPIICKIHGKFEQTPANHIYCENGCPKCKTFKGELTIDKWLSKHNIIFTPQYIFRGCKNKRFLKFDFYLPKLNMCIEYDGPHHYRPVKFNSKMSDEQARKNFEATKLRDKLKNEYCSRNHIKLKRISYEDKYRIGDILNIYVR